MAPPITTPAAATDAEPAAQDGVMVSVQPPLDEEPMGRMAVGPWNQESTMMPA